ncbi:MAG: hypothetical protein ACK4IY_05160 [Chitinophagales bacterium]
MKLVIFLTVMLYMQSGIAQSTFNYTVALNPITIEGLPGLHSYAYAQADNKWLIIGGRKDGIHARQPFNAFPESKNNTDIIVIDIKGMRYYSVSVNTLPVNLKEQLQSTNMQAIQVEDTLYIMGGYGYAASADAHITFPYLTTVQVSELINAIMHGNAIESYFRQVADDAFCVTGGELGVIGNNFYLVGGQRFDGRYNPMNHPTFTQTYTDAIRIFTIDNSGAAIHFENISTLTDPVHLHRRDYNLIPQIFADGTTGYTISSGVFQIGADVPFLYPVDINATGYLPNTSFNQYLSNYHSAHTALFDSLQHAMHHLFFGGMSQYYYDGDVVMKDDRVPFVKTISLLSRFADGHLQESRLQTEMPMFTGAGAEFFPNLNLPYYNAEILRLQQLTSDTTVIGYIFGGIESTQDNPFTMNQTGATSAGATIYEVQLIKSEPAVLQTLNGANPYDMLIYPNPAERKINVDFYLPHTVDIRYYFTTINGQHLQDGVLSNQAEGNNTVSFELQESNYSPVFLTFIFDDIYFVTKPVILQ